MRTGTVQDMLAAGGGPALARLFESSEWRRQDGGIME